MKTVTRAMISAVSASQEQFYHKLSGVHSCVKQGSPITDEELIVLFDSFTELNIAMNALTDIAIKVERISYSNE